MGQSRNFKAQAKAIINGMKKLHLAILFLSLTSLGAFAQNQQAKNNKLSTDSITAAAIDQAALIYPQIRQFSITHVQGFAGNISAKANGSPLFDGRYQLGRTNINMSLPFLDTKNNALIGSLGVVHQFTKISEIKNLNPQQPVMETLDYIPMISLGASFTHRDSIFNHPITFSASLRGLFNPDFSRRQLTFTGIILVPIVEKRYTRLNLGLVVNIDPSSPIPAFIMLNYFHTFRVPNIDLLIDAPYRIVLRKPIKSRASLSLQSELVGNNSFFGFNTPNFPNKLTFSTLELKSGFLLEYRVTKKMVFSLSGGAMTTITSRIFEQGEKPKNYLVDNKHSTVPYAQVGISLLPFWRPFKMK